MKTLPAIKFYFTILILISITFSCGKTNKVTSSNVGGINTNTNTNTSSNSSSSSSTNTNTDTSTTITSGPPHYQNQTPAEVLTILEGKFSCSNTRVRIHLQTSYNSTNGVIAGALTKNTSYSFGSPLAGSSSQNYVGFSSMNDILVISQISGQQNVSFSICPQVSFFNASSVLKNFNYSAMRYSYSYNGTIGAALDSAVFYYLPTSSSSIKYYLGPINFRPKSH